mmetsp:Transcript_18078/g.60981  ORF Transcript_18078/g.60981 Transcript_18078/m.60981 type:complete len:639 (+) Transcript_18078:2067-3983(+)
MSTLWRLFESHFQKVLRRRRDRQIQDLVSKERVEGVESALRRKLPPKSTGADGRQLHRRQQLLELDEGGLEDGRVLRVDFSAKLVEHALRRREQLARFFRRPHEELGELVARPFDAVLDEVRKVAQSAHGNAAALGGGAALAVRLRLVRHDGFHVARRAHRPRLEERQLELDTLRVDVEPRLHVVQSVAHAVQTEPEGVVEECRFRLGADVRLHRGHAEVSVHGVCARPRARVDCHGRGGDGLGVADVVLSEEELPREVAEFDSVCVGDDQLAARAAANTVQSKVLDKLAPQSARPDDKVLEVGQVLHEAHAEDADEVVVAAAPRRAVRQRRRRLGEHLEEAKVRKPVDGRVLARALDDLLGDEAACEACQRLQFHRAVPGVRPRKVGVDLEVGPFRRLARKGVCPCRRADEVLGELQHGVGVALVVWVRRPLVLRFELEGAAKRAVHLHFPVRKRVVRQRHAVAGKPRVLQAVRERFKRSDSGDFLLRDEPARDVRRQGSRVADPKRVGRVALQVRQPPRRRSIQRRAADGQRRDRVPVVLDLAADDFGELVGRRLWRRRRGHAVGHHVANQAPLLARDGLDESDDGSFSVRVRDAKCAAVVDEDGRGEARADAPDEGDWRRNARLAASLVHLDARP